MDVGVFTRAMQYTPYIWPFIVSLFATIALGIYAVRHRDIPTVPTFIWLMVALTFWTFCYLMELSSASLAGKTFWLVAKYPGSTTGPVLWFVLSLCCYCAKSSTAKYRLPRTGRTAAYTVVT